MNNFQCPQCNTDNPEGAKFCKKCGAAMAAQENNQRRCAKGHVLEAGWDTCPWCGSGAGGQEDNRPSPKPSAQPADKKPARRKTVKEPGPAKPGSPPTGAGNKYRQPTDPMRNATRPERKGTVVMRADGDGKSEGDGKRLVGFLVSYTIDPAGKAFELREGRHLIGTGGNATIVISGVSSLSSEHAIILYRRGDFIIQDNLSTNGTFVDGEEIFNPTVLTHGAQIKLGEAAFTLVTIDQPGDKGE